MTNDKEIMASCAMPSNPEHWHQRRWKILVPLNSVDNTWMTLCSCFTKEAATAVVSSLLQNESGGPAEILIKVHYED